MNVTSVIHRYLCPGETLGEVLFGLIMVLTITLGAFLLVAEEEVTAHKIVLAAVGCNLAWGVIDGVLFALGSLFERGRRRRFIHAIKNAGSEAKALAAIEREFDVEDASLRIQPEDGARLYRSILALYAHAKPVPSGFVLEDFISAIIVFALVSSTALPGILPFILLPNVHLALRASNAILIILLFVVGYWWALYTEANPWRVGLSVVILGLSMVGVAIALGG